MADLASESGRKLQRRPTSACEPLAIIESTANLNIQQISKAVPYQALQGKGNTVRCMFADVEADVFVLVDGDDTYDAASAPLGPGTGQI
jgi:hypothetical protein